MPRALRRHYHPIDELRHVAAFHAAPLDPDRHPTTFRLLRTADRSAIFSLIAGTNTPIMAALLAGRARRWCLRGVWGLALAGGMAA